MHSAVDYDPHDGGLDRRRYTKGNSPNCQDNDWSTKYGAVSFSGAAAGVQMTAAAATSSTRGAAGCSTIADQSKATGRHPVCGAKQHPGREQVHRPSTSVGRSKGHAAPAETRSNPGAAAVHSRK
jgi:hypothetical protein